MALRVRPSCRRRSTRCTRPNGSTTGLTPTIAAGSSSSCTTSPRKRSSTASPSRHRYCCKIGVPVGAGKPSFLDRIARGGSPMLDIIISGGTAVLPTGAATADIGVQGGKIAAIGALGAGRTVDASGQIVIPGGIDPHVHCRWPMPTPGQTQPNLTDGPDRVSQAALFGGTTTLLDFALVDGDNTVQQAIERRQKEWAGDCYCDYGFHVMVQGKLDHTIPDQLIEAVAAGHATVKMFTTDITPSRQGRMVRFGDIWEVLKALAKAGGLATIHAEDNDIVMHMYEKLTREGRTGFENLAEVHNTLSEDLAFNRVIRLASNIEGCSLYMLHTSAATGVRAIAAARGQGVPIYGETLHQYLMYSAEDYKRPNGQIYHTYPSLKFPADQQ